MQYAHADALNIPMVAIIGADELAAGTVSLKNLSTGEQKTVTPDGLAAELASAN